MKKYKLIILIIASGGGVYDIFMEYWNKYMNIYPDIKSFFIFGQSSENTSSFNSFNFFNSLYKDVSIVSPTVESFIPGILQKTIYSFEYIEKNFEYEYIMRTNLSSFFDLNKLMVFINTLPREKLYCGKSWGKYASGSCFIVSKDVVNLMIENKDKLNYNLIDDVAIGDLLYDSNIKLIDNMRYKMLSKKLNNNNIFIQSINNTQSFFYYHRLRSLKYTKYETNKKNKELNDRINLDGNKMIELFNSVYLRDNKSNKNNKNNKQKNIFTQTFTKVNNVVGKDVVSNRNTNPIKQPIKLTITKIASNIIKRTTLSVFQNSKMNRSNRSNSRKINSQNRNANNKKNKTSQKRISYISLNQNKTINVIKVKSIK